MAYKPRAPYNTSLYLLVPNIQNIKGVTKKVYPELKEEMLINASFKTYGGTESTVNGIFTVIDTANVETWYRPDITSDCRVVRANDGAVFEIIGEPENIDMRNLYLKFKVKRVKGGA